MAYRMIVFLEVLSAILLSAKIIGLAEISTIKCLIPLIAAAILQLISIVWLDKLEDGEVYDEESEED